MAIPFGLGWESAIIGSTPIWLVEPDITEIEAIARYHLAVPTSGRCAISFLAQGAFNKVYTVDTGHHSFIFRVSLPVDPAKVENEVTTMALVREKVHAFPRLSAKGKAARLIGRKTNIPVAQVYAYDSTNHNVLRFPYMLMERIEGTPLDASWRVMSLVDKKGILTQLAAFAVQLQRAVISDIGSLMPDNHSKCLTGRVVTDLYHTHEKVDETMLGPFDSTQAWFEARLERYLATLRSAVRRYDGEEDEPDYPAVFAAWKQDQLDMAEELKSALDSLSAQCLHDAHHPITTALHHIDLHPRNILVDSRGRITGILDWEFTPAVPLWATCELPRLLWTCKRLQEPKKEEYSKPSDFEEDEQDLFLDGVNILYWETLDEWQATVLRPFYLSEMDRIAGPDEQGKTWSQKYQETKFLRLIRQRLDNLERGSHGELEVILSWFDGYAFNDDGILPLPEGVLPDEDRLAWDEQMELDLMEEYARHQAQHADATEETFWAERERRSAQAAQ